MCHYGQPGPLYVHCVPHHELPSLYWTWSSRPVSEADWVMPRCHPNRGILAHYVCSRSLQLISHRVYIHHPSCRHRSRQTECMSMIPRMTHTLERSPMNQRPVWEPAIWPSSVYCGHHVHKSHRSQWAHCTWCKCEMQTINCSPWHLTVIQSTRW